MEAITRNRGRRRLRAIKFQANTCSNLKHQAILIRLNNCLPFMKYKRPPEARTMNKSRPAILALKLAATILIAHTLILHTLVDCDSSPMGLQVAAPAASGSGSRNYVDIAETLSTGGQSGEKSPINQLNSNSNPNPKRGAGSSKANLISSLSESIERQHFLTGFKSPASVVHSYKRPSKFDSNYDDEIAIRHGFKQTSQNQRPKQPATSYMADESIAGGSGMRQILALHELAAARLPVSQKLDSQANVKRPAVASKIVNQFLAYVAPIVDNSAAASVQAASFIQSPFNSMAHLKNSSFKPQEFLQQTRPFVARSIRNIYLKNRYQKAALNFDPLDPTAAEPSKLSVHSAANKRAKKFLSLSPQIGSVLSKPAKAVSQAANRLEQLSPPSGSNLNSISSGSEKQRKDSPEQAEASFAPPKYEQPVNWLISNKLAQSYIQDSLRGLLTLSQLPILGGQISTAPSILESSNYFGKFKQPNKFQQTRARNQTSGHVNPMGESQRKRAMDELYRYAYILSTSLRRKRKDPLNALASSSPVHQFGSQPQETGLIRKRGQGQQKQQQKQLIEYTRSMSSLLSTLARIDLTKLSPDDKRAKPRGVMWEMATDPSLAVTVFHLLERASVALPLGFLLMPFVRMIRNPFSGIHLGRVLPARASHRSIDYETLTKQLNAVDKILNRALKSAHREF